LPCLYCSCSTSTLQNKDLFDVRHVSTSVTDTTQTHVIRFNR